MRKVFVEAKVNIVIDADDGADIGEVIANFFNDEPNEDATVEDCELLDYNITDSK